MASMGELLLLIVLICRLPAGGGDLLNDVALPDITHKALDFETSETLAVLDRQLGYRSLAQSQQIPTQIAISSDAQTQRLR
jgi:hypothetical protein